MLFKPIPNLNRKRPAAFIYAVVFSSRCSVWLVLLLFTSFMLQPFHQAFANEAAAGEAEVVPEAPPIAEPVAPQTPPAAVENKVSDATAEPDVSVSSAIGIDAVAAESTSENSPKSVSSVREEISKTVGTNGVTDTSDADVDVAVTDQIVKSSQITSSTTVSKNTSTASSSSVSGDGLSNGTEDDIISTSSSVTNDEEAVEEGVDDSGGTSGDDDAIGVVGSTTESVSADITETTDQDQDTVSATTSVVNEINLAEAQNLVTEDNYYQFSRQSCVAIGDGTYHCSVKKDTGIDLNAVVYADIGSRSNMEIFMRTSEGEIKQLTDNDYEDTAPNYNAESMQIVWQRLVDDRYQIVRYDIKEGVESQLTYSRTNNMEPKVSEAGVVWQAWDGNDWEIMYFDGKFTDQITDNQVQDVAPAIDDGYILWSVLGSDKQEAKVYSLASGETLTINGYEGGVITNPRFVLVYDTQYENGDVVTQGFDPTTGLSAPLASEPAQKPIDLPDTDGTGETRALIQNKSSNKNVFDLDGTKDNTGSSSPNGVPNGATSSSSVSNTLDLTAPLAAATSSALADDIALPPKATSSESILELTDYDLILLPTQSTSTEIGTGTPLNTE